MNQDLNLAEVLEGLADLADPSGGGNERLARAYHSETGNLALPGQVGAFTSWLEARSKRLARRARELVGQLRAEVC